MRPYSSQNYAVFSRDGSFGFGQAGRSSGAVAFRADDVVVAQKDSFPDETLATFVARETAAVIVAAFERHVVSVFRAEACTACAPSA